MIRQQLSQKFLQRLSPQQIQLMKLLQIPTATLEQRIKEELEANPALDEGDEKEEEFGENLHIQEDNHIQDNKEDFGEDSRDDDGAPDEEFSLDDYLTDYIDYDNSSYKLK